MFLKRNDWLLISICIKIDKKKREWKKYLNVCVWITCLLSLIRRKSTIERRRRSSRTKKLFSTCKSREENFWSKIEISHKTQKNKIFFLLFIVTFKLKNLVIIIQFFVFTATRAAHIFLLENTFEFKKSFLFIFFYWLQNTLKKKEEENFKGEYKIAVN